MGLDYICVEDEKKKKSIQVDHEVWKKLKLRCLESDKDMAEVVAELVEYFGL